MWERWQGGRRGQGWPSSWSILHPRCDRSLTDDDRRSPGVLVARSRRPAAGSRRPMPAGRTSGDGKGQLATSRPSDADLYGNIDTRWNSDFKNNNSLQLDVKDFICSGYWQRTTARLTSRELSLTLTSKVHHSRPTCICKQDCLLI